MMISEDPKYRQVLTTRFQVLSGIGDPWIGHEHVSVSCLVQFSIFQTRHWFTTILHLRSTRTSLTLTPWPTSRSYCGTAASVPGGRTRITYATAHAHVKSSIKLSLRQDVHETSSSTFGKHAIAHNACCTYACKLKYVMCRLTERTVPALLPTIRSPNGSLRFKSS